MGATITDTCREKDMGVTFAALAGIFLLRCETAQVQALAVSSLGLLCAEFDTALKTPEDSPVVVHLCTLINTEFQFLTYSTF